MDAEVLPEQEVTPALLAALLWLHPMVSNGTVEATGEPTLGARVGFSVYDTRFEGAVGTGYQAIRARAGVVEAEHLFRDGEHNYYRLTAPMSERWPLYFTLEYELHRAPAWNFPNKSGQVPVTVTQQERIYVTWIGRRVIARLGTDKQSVGFTLNAHW